MGAGVGAGAEMEAGVGAAAGRRVEIRLRWILVEYWLNIGEISVNIDGSGCMGRNEWRSDAEVVVVENDGDDR